MLEEITRDPKYLAWVRLQRCCVKGEDCSGPVQAHHTARAYGGLRGDDRSCVPICVVHHYLVQYHFWIFKKRFNFIPDPEYANQKYYKRYQAERDG